jgi:hypothetical protein
MRTGMKFLVSMYVVMAIMVLVNLESEFMLKGEYSAIASWLTVTLFFHGTLGPASSKNECWDINP